MPENGAAESGVGNSLPTDFPYIRTAEEPDSVALAWADLVVNLDPGAIRRDGVPPSVPPALRTNVRSVLTVAAKMLIEPASIMTLAALMSDVEELGWCPTVLLPGSPDQARHALELAGRVRELQSSSPDSGVTGWTTRLFEGSIIGIPPMITRMFIDASDTPPHAETAEVVLGASTPDKVEFFRFRPPGNLVIPSMGIDEPTTQDSLLRSPDAVIHEDGSVWFADTEAGGRLQALADTIPFGAELDSFAEDNRGVPTHLRVTIAALFDSLADPEDPSHDPGLVFMSMAAPDAHTVAALGIALWNHYAPKFLSEQDQTNGEGA